MILNAAPIIARVESYYGLDPGDVLSTRRFKTLVHAREVVMFILREAGWTLYMIGAVLLKDHTTIIHGLRQLAAKMKGDPNLRRQCDQLKAEFQAPSVPVEDLIE